MEALDTQLQQLNQEKEYLAAPVVVMANFAPLPSNLPPKRVEFDWSDEFVFSPRQVPQPERWPELLPEIMALSTQSGLVRYHQGSSSLSTAFAVGQALRNVGGRRLAIEQHSPDKTTVWFSQVTPDVTESFVVHQSAVNAGAVTQQGQPGKDALVVVFALTQTTAPVVVGEVGA
ncbi:MAG: hypothetical protein GY788_27615, partial [bacterium]|nr:hypothetical protein [bacterium]